MTLHRAAAAVAAATLALSLCPASSADASGKHFRTVYQIFDAELQLCKVAVDDGARFMIYGRLDNTASDPKDKRLGAVRVLRNGADTKHEFETAWIKGGRISPVEHQRVKNSPSRTLSVAISMPYGAHGRNVELSEVHDC